MGLSLKNIGKKIVGAGENLATGIKDEAVSGVKSLYDIGRGAAASGDIPFTQKNPLALQHADQAKAIDNGAFLQPIARPLAQFGETVVHPFSAHTVTPSTPQDKIIFGNAPIQNIQAGVKTNFQQHSNLALPQRVGLAGLYGLGQAAQDAFAINGKGNAVKTAIKDTSKVAKGLSRADKIAQATKQIADSKTATDAAETVAPTVAQKVAPKVTLAVKGTKPNEIDKAVADLQAHYNETPKFNAGDITGQANGYRAVGSRLSTKLGNVLGKNLTDDEQRAAFDALQGVSNDNLTARAAKAAASLKPLYDSAAGVRKLVHGDAFNKVRDYAPRIARPTVSGAIRGGGRLLGKIKNLSDLGNLDSVFSRSRQIGKFIDSKGNATFGKASDLGLTKAADGTFRKGNETFKQVATNTHELKQALGQDYLDKVGHVSAIYHADTTSLKARADALAELKANPNAHGLYTKDQVTTGIAPEGVRPITGVSGLADKDGSPLFATEKDAQSLEKDHLFGTPERSGLAGKVYDAVSNFATQAIVLNPVFHGMNQLYQAAIAVGNIPGGGGWIRLAKGIGGVTEKDVIDFYKAGGHSPDYGSTVRGIISEATGGASKINSKAMASIELRLRVGLYKASVESGMKPAKAIKNIDLFLGDSKTLSKTARRLTIFGHYFKTMTKAIGTQIAHPIEQRGTIANTALLAALTAAVSQGYQEATGNKNAYARVPGELGLIKEGVGAAQDLAHGNVLDAASLGTNRLNPVAKEIGQQVFNEDLFTGKPTSDTGDVTAGGKTIIPGGRAGHAVQSLIAPAQQVEKGVGGKRSAAELAINQLGINTPHAKGNPAAPKVGFLNTPGSKPAQGNDKTGYSQQQTYFSTTDDAKKGMSTKDAATYDQLTGATSTLNDKQLQAHYATMASSPIVTAAIVKQKQDYAKKTGTPLDPLYGNDITPEQRAAYFHLQSVPYKGDDYNQQKDSNAGWLTKLQDARNSYFSKVDAGSSGVPPAERVQPPTFDAQTEKDLTTAGELQGSDKAQFIATHGDLTKAYTAIAKYTNDKRVAQGDTPFKMYPNADPDTQAALNNYEGLSTSAQRSSWIKSNPDAYKKVQDYLTGVSEYQLANSAGTDKYAGATPSQAELKSAYSLGQYDIAKVADANGNSTYSLDPALAYSSSHSGGFNSAGYAAAKFADRVAKSQENAGKSGSSVKKPRVTYKKGGKATKVAIKNVRRGNGNRVALKRSKV